MSETVIIDARRLRELASQVSRLLPDRRDPHRFHEQKSEAVAQLRALAVGNCTAVAASARLRVFSTSHRPELPAHQRRAQRFLCAVHGPPSPRRSDCCGRWPGPRRAGERSTRGN